MRIFRGFVPSSGTNDSSVRELIHDPGRPVESDLEHTLQHADGRLILLDDKFPGLCKERIHILILLRAADADLLYLRQLRLHVLHCRPPSVLLFFEEIHHIRYFLVGDKRTLYTRRLLIALWDKTAYRPFRAASPLRSYR